MTVGDSRVSEAVPVTCAHCGASADEPPLTWVSSVERGRTTYLCDRCARDNLRSIEARLDGVWW